ncbi:MAG: diaminopimelate epimerase, partial [Campylobacterota bacterium]|nr:diaminopimelate epimerase [Campylobacterota bacterium]
MKISKYSASGNDFVIFHSDVKVDRSSLAKELCHRQDGIGADGLIVIIPNVDYDFEWQFYNSDGSTAEMCGNGSRACAHYAFAHDLAPKNMRFLTEAGVINAEVDGTIVLSELTPPRIIDKTIEFGSKSWWLLDTGVPHLVSFTQNIEEFDIEEARELRFKYNANVNITAVEGKNLRVRTYERGV